MVNSTLLYERIQVKCKLTHTLTHTYTRTHTQSHTHIHTHTIHSHTLTHALTHSHTPHAHTLTHARTYTPYTHTHTHTHTHSHKHRHTHTHTHTHTGTLSAAPFLRHLPQVSTPKSCMQLPVTKSIVPYVTTVCTCSCHIGFKWLESMLSRCLR